MIKIFVIGICSLFILSATFSSALVLNNKIETNNAEVKASTIPSKIDQITDKINETLLENYLQTLVDLGPRMTGTYGSEKAAEYLTTELEKMGYDVEYQYWEEFGNIWNFRSFKDKNIIVTLNGTNDPEEDILIFNAHYDTTKDSVGGVDDGTGVAGVLGAAYAMSQFTFNRTIKFILFSGEEVGLLGSTEYAKEAYKNDEDIYLEINADMIGVSNTAENGKRINLSGTKDAKWIMDKIKDLSITYNIGFENIPQGFMDPHYYRGWSDYFGFIQHGYESIAFWESGRYDYANTPQDSIDYVNYSYLTNATKIIAATLAYLADAELEYPQIKITSPKKGKMYFEDRIIKDLKGTKSIVFDDVLIYLDVEEGSAPIDRIELYYNGRLLETIKEKPYTFRLNKLSFRKHLIEAYVYDTEGRSDSDFVYIYYYNFLKNR